MNGIAETALHTAETLHLPAGTPAVERRSAVREIMTSILSGMPPGANFGFEPREVRIVRL